MTWTETTTPGETWALAKFDVASEMESPFVGAEAPFEAAELEVSELSEAYSGAAGFNRFAGETEDFFVSPFKEIGEAPTGDEVWNELLTELRDPEFEDALAEIVQEAAGVHAEQGALFSGETGGLGPSRAAEATYEHFEPLAVSAERLLDEIAGLVGERDASALGESDVQQLLESFESVGLPQLESPAFEEFLGGLKRLAKRVVSKAVDLGKRGLAAVSRVLPINAILQRLKSLIRPLLRRVLTVAINRLPVALRPAANKLRQKILRFEDEAAISASEEVAQLLESQGEHPATAGLEVVHQNFTLELAELMLTEQAEGEQFAPGESYEDLEDLEDRESYEAYEAGGYASAANELDAARIQLIRELGELQEGQSAAPAFERFLPAVLPALRVGIRIAGRDRVIRFLAGYLAKMLDRFVGGSLSRPLSQAIVDAGLRLLTLEAPSEEDVRHAGPAAVAAVAEATAHAVLANEDTLFEDPVALEVETAVAFQEALARNFPSSMLRTDRLEMETEAQGGGGAMWALRPRVYWYKKYTRVFEKRIDANMAAAIRSFGGVTLAAELRASGTTLPVQAKVHLYEALPGAYLSRIAALERHVPGMGADGWRRFHPLDVRAASTLLSEPGLGKDVPARFTANRNLIACGQRFYYLEVPRAGGGDRRTPTPTSRCAPPSQAFVTLDGRPAKNEVRVSIFVCEPEAQAIASRLRQGNTTAFVVALRTSWQAAIRSVASSPTSRVRVLQESNPLLEQQVAAAAAGGAMSGIMSKAAEIIVGKLIDAVIRLAMDYGRAKASDFIREVDKPANGVTVVVTVPAPGLSVAMRGGLAGSVASAGLLRTLLGLFSGRSLPAMHTLPGLVRA